MSAEDADTLQFLRRIRLPSSHKYHRAYNLRPEAPPDQYTHRYHCLHVIRLRLAWQLPRNGGWLCRLCRIQGSPEHGNSAHGCRTEAERRRYNHISHASWRGRNVSPSPRERSAQATSQYAQSRQLIHRQGYGQHQCDVGRPGHHNT